MIGAGEVGGPLGRLIAATGHRVLFSGHGPDRARAAAAEAGPNADAATVPAAIARADVVVLAVPFDRYADVARQAGPALLGKIVVDLSNPIVRRGREIVWLDIPDDPPHAEHQRRVLGDVRLVKVFGHLCPGPHWEAIRHREQREPVSYGGDDEKAKRVVAGLLRDAGFDPADIGALADTRRLQPQRNDQ